MGVMRCHRNDCENVMCDRYNDTHGYICDDCFEGLVGRGVGTDISEFMLSSPNHRMREATESFFGAIFPRPEEDDSD